MIEIEGLCFQYGKSDFRLEIAELSVPAAAKVAFIGPSGSGKTTLLNLLAGIHLPERGRIVVAGVDLRELDDAARRSFRIRSVGFVFQDFGLLDYLNVEENILLPGYINRTLRHDADTRQTAAELATSMGLGEKLRRRVTQLSRGEQQRVAICRALLHKPKLILADEPTGNLDRANKLRCMEVLETHAAKLQATLVVVTHDESLLDRFPRVIDLEQLRAS